MSLLSICQNAALEIGISKPTEIVNSTRREDEELLSFVLRAGADLRTKFAWPQLRKLHTITLTASASTYALPSDFDKHLYDTQWDRTNQWPLIGPLTPQEWRARQEGITTTSPRYRFSVFGYGLSQFNLDPTPDSGDAGNVLAMEYQSSTWFLPQEWAASTVYVDGAYVSYDGNVYSCTTGGTSGATAPTHTSGTGSDDVITWTYESDPYQTFLADTDYVVLPEKMIELEVIWRFLRANGLPYEHLYKESKEFNEETIGKLRGARTLNLAAGTLTRRFIGPENVPDTGFG